MTLYPRRTAAFRTVGRLGLLGLAATLLITACTTTAVYEPTGYVRAAAFFSRVQSEAAGYGAYTYVLFPVRSDRNAAFLQTLLRRTDVHFTKPAVTERQVFNMFYVPVDRSHVANARDLADRVSRTQETASAAATARLMGLYDVTFAREILRRFCAASLAQGRAVNCNGDGPFLATLRQPRWREPTSQIRVIDLSSFASASDRRLIEKLTDPATEMDFNDAVLDVIAWIASGIENGPPRR